MPVLHAYGVDLLLHGCNIISISSTNYHLKNEKDNSLFIHGYGRHARHEWFGYQDHGYNRTGSDTYAAWL